MLVKALHLKNFRNLQEFSLRPESRLCFLLGSNGRGKTSVLEALGYVASLRSFRGSKTPEVIQWGASQGEIQAILEPELKSEHGDFTSDIRVRFFRGSAEAPDPLSHRSSKIALINGKSYRSTSAFLSQRFGQFELGVHAIIFNPSDHDLVRGEPAERRGYLDRTLSAEDLDYLETLSRYLKLVEQRNVLLKQEVRPSREELLGFTEPMVSLGSQLVLKRLQWLSRALPTLSRQAQRIAPHQPLLKLIYFSNWVPEIEGISCSNKDLSSLHFSGQAPLASLETIETAYWKRLGELESAEWRAGSTLVGPHRDDWGFFYGDQLLKGHGSQGEVRTALLALKLSELELFREATGHRPLFLLDDFSSELDRERRLLLLRDLTQSDLQVFVTSTEEPPGARELGQCVVLEEENGNHASQRDSFSVSRSHDGSL